MYSITKVCGKCDNNRFKVVQQGASFEVLCSKCNNISDVVTLDNIMIISKCRKCSSEVFKVQTGKKEDKIKQYTFTCSNCEFPAEFILIDDQGNEITKEQKEILDIKKLVGALSKKVEIFEDNIHQLGSYISEVSSEYEGIIYKVEGIYNEVIGIKHDTSVIESQLENLQSYFSKVKE